MKISRTSNSALSTSLHASPCGLPHRVESRRTFRPARLNVRAANNDNGDKLKTKQELLVKDLKKSGISQETAQRVLDTWEKTGAKSPEALRKLLINRTVRSAGTVGLQTLLDAGASLGAFSAGTSVAIGAPFFGKGVVQFLLYSLGFYFSSSAFLDIFTLGAIAFSGYNVSADTEAFLNAVREVAGTKSGINVVQKAKEAVNIGKIASALNEISDILKGRASDGSSSSLDNLGVYLTLSKAEAAGFNAESYGLTGEQAGQIAASFSKYDTNDDFVLSTTEVAQLFREEGYQFNEAEINEAIKLLDSNGDKKIQFNEFVEWWQKSVPANKKEELENKQLVGSK